MKWPWVLASRLDSVKKSNDILREIIDRQDIEIIDLEGRVEAQARYDKLLDVLIAMKQQGFAPVPPRSETPKGVAYRGQELVSRDKLVRQFSEEPGVTPQQAEEAADQILAELQ